MRIASGMDDPFHPDVEVLAHALPAGATVVSTKGCHTNGFELSQEPDSLAFLAAYLTGGLLSRRAGHLSPTSRRDQPRGW